MSSSIFIPEPIHLRRLQKFQRADDHATKESRVTASVMPMIEGDPGDTKCVASDIPFTNLDHLTDGSLDTHDSYSTVTFAGTRQVLKYW
ncbi:hypothetical protein BGZ61DRAFT_469600 [Ilyonectria robusta]|uniref:uncharacterized protein n=1 Tax=Ilyonectria robusta TaxID=1079257 RepID=UPI001E8CEB37|nr:uncharacterized protein BGZ61DRAFT_469600 [Ilyonectria robusta]KAH8649398.1 hypothetical protein BGZ61DRAFT_469600 [Ilyonectria robusta]